MTKTNDQDKQDLATFWAPDVFSAQPKPIFNAKQLALNVFKQWKLTNNFNQDEIEQANLKINKLEKDYQNQYPEQKFFQLKRQYFWKRWLVFNKKVQNLKMRINEWEQAQSAYEQAVAYQYCLINQAFLKLIGSKQRINFINSALNQAGLINQTIDYQLVNLFLKNHFENLVAISDLVAGLNNGLKTYNLSVYQLDEIVVPYQSQKTFSYYNSQTKTTEFETVVATYYAPKPVIKLRRICFSNFYLEPMWNFTLKSGAKMGHDYRHCFDDENFNKHYQIEHAGGREVDLRLVQWFNLTTQANFVKLKADYPQAEFRLRKTNDNFLVAILENDQFRHSLWKSTLDKLATNQFRDDFETVLAVDLQTYYNETHFLDKVLNSFSAHTLISQGLVAQEREYQNADNYEYFWWAKPIINEYQAISDHQYLQFIKLVKQVHWGLYRITINGYRVVEKQVAVQVKSQHVGYKTLIVTYNDYQLKEKLTNVFYLSNLKVCQGLWNETIEISLNQVVATNDSLIKDNKYQSLIKALQKWLSLTKLWAKTPIKIIINQHGLLVIDPGYHERAGVFFNQQNLEQLQAICNNSF